MVAFILLETPKMTVLFHSVKAVFIIVEKCHRRPSTGPKRLDLVADCDLSAFDVSWSYYPNFGRTEKHQPTRDFLWNKPLIALLIGDARIYLRQCGLWDICSQLCLTAAFCRAGLCKGAIEPTSSRTLVKFSSQRLSFGPTGPEAARARRL